ncbi:MAG: hypothetical protein M1830_003869 [Pleopsidium flavum]|nr:MAG: hypothetical protein M1830_003869 [Pleopsidium flavum]
MAIAHSVNHPPDIDKGPMVMGLCWATTALAIIAVWLRAYVRTKTRAQGWDDYVAYMAMVDLLSFKTEVANTLEYGFGRHVVYVLPTVQGVTKWTIIAEIQSYSAVFLVKLSVCLFILRVLGPTHRYIARFLKLMMAIMAMLTVAAMLTDALQCFPLAKAWNRTLKGTCISHEVLTRLTEGFGAIGCATDFACVIIPIFIFHGLQMNARTKTALYIVMGLGLITAACAIGKSITSNFASDDPTYDFVPVEIWAAFEGNVGLFVACMPVLRPLFIKVLNGSTLDSKATDRNRDAGDKTTSPLPYLNVQRPPRSFQPQDNDSDKNKLIPVGNIMVSTMMDVNSDLRRSIDLEMTNLFERDRRFGVLV